jgi:predicted SAM-dependent methyltransferase
MSDLILADRRDQLARALSACGRLHIGCNEAVLPGWVNVDIDPFPGAFRWDLRDPLPVAGPALDWIFSEHFIEHITREDAAALLRRCYDTLRPGGVFRTSTPDLAFMVGEYLAGRTGEWANLGWLPGTPCRMMNEGMRLWGHQYLYDIDELVATFRGAGFARIERVGWRASAHPVFENLETRPFHHELIIEATKL